MQVYLSILSLLMTFSAYKKLNTTHLKPHFFFLKKKILKLPTWKHAEAEYARCFNRRSFCDMKAGAHPSYTPRIGDSAHCLLFFTHFVLGPLSIY